MVFMCPHTDDRVGHLNFLYAFCKTLILFKEKKIKLWNKWHILWDVTKRLCSVLYKKQYISFLHIYIMTLRVQSCLHPIYVYIG